MWSTYSKNVFLCAVVLKNQNRRRDEIEQPINTPPTAQRGHRECVWRVARNKNVQMQVTNVIGFTSDPVCRVVPCRRGAHRTTLLNQPNVGSAAPIYIVCEKLNAPRALSLSFFDPYMLSPHPLPICFPLFHSFGHARTAWGPLSVAGRVQSVINKKKYQTDLPQTISLPITMFFCHSTFYISYRDYHVAKSIKDANYEIE